MTERFNHQRSQTWSVLVLQLVAETYLLAAPLWPLTLCGSEKEARQKTRHVYKHVYKRMRMVPKPALIDLLAPLPFGRSQPTCQTQDRWRGAELSFLSFCDPGNGTAFWKKKKTTHMCIGNFKNKFLSLYIRACGWKWTCMADEHDGLHCSSSLMCIVLS